MRCKVAVIIIVVTLLIMPIFSPRISADKQNNDKDSDGIPNNVDYEKVKNNINVTNISGKSRIQYMESSNATNWSFDYGSDATYGAWIGNVFWQQNYCIFKANVPWIVIDSVIYEIPNMFRTIEVGCINGNKYHLVYQYYIMNISETYYEVEIHWVFPKNPVYGAGKIEIDVLFYADDDMIHSIYIPFRIDFDIVDPYYDRHYCYGSSGWSAQNIEAIQFTYPPVDPIWGMKVKQQDHYNPNRWGGISTWDTDDKNYLLKYHGGEFKGNPNDYVNGEYTHKEDDVLWTTASISSENPSVCGPTLYVN